MELEVRDLENNLKSEKIVLDEAIFAMNFNEPLVHQVVTAYLAGGRAGTHAQKTRSEVRGGGIKPWKQKGTGRARAGTIRSPLWRGGGVTFAAKQASYEQKVNKKMYRRALASILSELIRQEHLIVVENLALETHKTKDLLTKLQKLNIKNALIISEEIDKNLYLASRNLYDLEVSDVRNVNPVSLLRYSKVVATVPVMKKFAEILQ